MASSHGEDSALTQITGAWGHGGEGQAACPIQVWAWGSEWRKAARGGGGVPSLQAVASSPSSTQTAAGTGRGLLLKHWWLQAAGRVGGEKVNSVALAWPRPSQCGPPLRGCGAPGPAGGSLTSRGL